MLGIPLCLAGDKSGVSPNTISLPKGPGSIEGLGDSFQPTLNTGTAKYSIALKVPPGTAGHDPALQLTYEGGGGNGVLGFGWSLPTASVQRQTDKGIPAYGENVGFARPDRFVNDAKEELVPRADGFFFCENEGAFVRYQFTNGYWSAWLPNGTRLDFGMDATARIEEGTNRVFSWLLQRETDTRGNTILYVYTNFPSSQNLNQKYLAGIRYGPGAPPWNNFHFATFTYEDRPDWFEDCRAGFVVRTGRRLKAVTIGTQGPVLAQHAQGDFNQDGTPDNLVRRYDLRYLDYAGTNSHWSLLAAVTPVGADGVSTLPPSTFSYAVCHPSNEVSAASSGIDGLNEPPIVMSSELVDFVDLNGDALPDLLKTGGPTHEAYLNRGQTNLPTGPAIAWSAPAEVGSGTGDAWLFSLNAAATHLADLDGDGRADLAHKTGDDAVFYFSNLGTNAWSERQAMAYGADPPPAPFGEPNVRTADIDFDKRTDLIRGDGLQYQIWFNLGSNTYSERITVPQDFAFDFANPAVQVADMNGDRLPDIARILPTSLEVTIGLGYGRFTAPTNLHLPEATLDAAQLARAKLTDITGDGLADIVLERAAGDELWYWINLGNQSFGPRRRITGLPSGLGPQTVVRWADLNGNGSTDLVYADSDATPRLRTFDVGKLLNCGSAANVLTAISNGIGRVTLIGYAPSTKFMLEDAAAGRSWRNSIPFPVTVVACVTNLDSLGHAYLTKFRYHDGYYDPVEKQFRGFAHVEQVDVGDLSAPTQVTRSHFDTGRTFEAMKGKLLRLTAETEGGGVFTDDFTAWQLPPRVLMTGINGQPVVYAHPTGTTNLIQELGQGTERRLESEMAFDDFGNQTLDADFGIVEGANRSAFDDERITVSEYALNTNAWILRALSRQEVRDEHGAVISRTDHFYDDETFSGNNPGLVTLGNLTLRREWVSPSNSTAVIQSARTKYDAYGNPVLILDPLAAATGGGVDFAMGHAREIAFDPRFHCYPVTETIHLGEGKAPLVFQATYDEGFGTVTTSTDFNNNVSAYGYDVFARLTHIVKPGDTPTYPTVEYNYALAVPVAGGGVVNYVETRQRDKSEIQNPKSEMYLIARQFVDGLGRKLLGKQEAEPTPGSSNPRVVVTAATEFNVRQKPARVLNPFFTTLSGALDELLAFEHIEAPGWQGQFHAEGNLVTLPLATAHATRTSYDATLRPLLSTNPDGTFRRTAYEPLVTRSFDENDVDPASPHHDTPMVHANDGLGRLVRVQEISRLNDDGTPAGTPRAWTTRYQYDLNDQLTRITDSQNNIKTFAYDGLKRKVGMNDPNRGVMSFLYDDASNLIETTDAKAQRITYTYDGANRIRTEKYHDSLPLPSWRSSGIQNPASSNSVVYHYDVPYPNLPPGDNSSATARHVKGALAWVEDLSGEEHTSYDERGRVESVVKRVPDPQFLSLAAGGGQGGGAAALVGYRTAFAYDSLDRLTNLTYPDADQLRYEYNDRNLLQRIPGGFVAGQTQPGNILSNLLYLPSGQQARIDYGNGVRTTYDYDSRLRLKRLHTVSPTAGVGGTELDLIHFAYDFDGVSNIKSIEDRRPGAAVPEGDPRRNTQLFQYDDLYRLTRVQYSFESPGQAKRNDGEINYRYDRIGNMLAQTSTLTNHLEKDLPVANLGQMDSGGAAGRWNRVGRNTGDAPGPHALTRIQDPRPQTPDRVYPYDANGNMTSIDGLACTWDYKDRLVAVENDEMRAAYAYDYTDRRILKDVAYKPGSANFTNHEPRITTLYINKYFEVREHDAPTKYVWNGNTRVARVTGSLTTHIRVQRLRLYQGWNLCSVAVASTSPLWGEGRGEVLSAAVRWNPTTLGWDQVFPSDTVPAGAVLWLKATTNATLAITGTYTDPTSRTVTTIGDFLPNACLEVWDFKSAFSNLASATASTYDAQLTRWLSWLPPPLELQSDLSAFLAPGEAVFARADAPSQLEVPDSALRIRYYHQDHLGSSSVNADANGQVVESVSNYSFGHPRHSSRQRGIHEPFGYTQKEQDIESGLRYFEARFQVGTLARFTRLDPLARDIPLEWLNRPQLLNLSAYGGNNPLKYRDPSGKALETAWDAFSLSMGIASIKSWDENTSFLEKALDVGGVVLDTAAIAVPFIPGGAGAAIKAGKLATKADDLIDAGKAIKAAKSGDAVKYTAKAAESGPNIAYRSLNAGDAEALAAGRGLSARAPSGTLTPAEHVANVNPAGSPWISTTRNLEVARGYDGGNGMVAIDLNKVPSLQVEVWRTAPRVNGVQGLPYHRSLWAQEVTIFQEIPASAILGRVK